MKKQVVIIGGGISGLSTAYYLDQFATEKNLELEIFLIEKTAKLGGCLGTQQTNGCLMEEGAESFITLKTGVLDLVKELKIENELIETNANERQSYIYSKGKLRVLPEGFYLFAPSKIWNFIFSSLLSWPGKLRVLLEYFMPAKKIDGDESIGAFVERRFGKECVVSLAQPMIGGIYGANIYNLSLNSTFPNLAEMENKNGGVIRGLMKKRRSEEAEATASGPRYSLFLSFKKGMGSLILALNEALRLKIKNINRHVAKIDRIDQKYHLKFKSGESLQADCVCLATSANDSAILTSNIDTNLSHSLSEIAYESSVTINFLFSLSSCKKPSGFGFVVPRSENSPILGCTFSSNKFEDRSSPETFLIRCFIATAENDALLSYSDAQLSNLALTEIHRMTEFQGTPILSYVKKYKKVLPQYCVGHKKRVEQIRENIGKTKNLYVTGNYFDGTGVPDCVSQAKQTASIMIHDLLNSK